MEAKLAIAKLQLIRKRAYESIVESLNTLICNSIESTCDISSIEESVTNHIKVYHAGISKLSKIIDKVSCSAVCELTY